MSTDGYYWKSDAGCANDDDDYIKVCPEEGDEVMELPKEDDGSLHLRTLTTNFPGAVGLKYKGPTGVWRAIKGTSWVFQNILLVCKKRSQ